MRRAALPVVLLIAGSLLAHDLGYRLVAPNDHVRSHLPAASGHAYLQHAPAVLAVLLALLPVCLAVHGVGGLAGRRPGRAFVALPVIGFSLQEHLERWGATGQVPLDAAAEPTFLVGLGLQVLVALAALGVARVVLGVAERLAGGRRGDPSPTRARRGPRPSSGPRRRSPRAPRASGVSQRGPPPPRPALT